MLRDVFYYGKKPNVHPREKFAKSLLDARNQATTEHFWIINEFCDYRNFDWDFDFEFLPDEDVWAEDHNNIWPSVHQKDSGTWLCPKKHSDINIYRADVDPLSRKNEIHNFWNLLESIDTNKFDFSWHPDPTDPPYIYAWGCKFFPVEFKICLEYIVPGATEYKYMNTIVELLPSEHLIEHVKVDKNKFDLSWRPDPRDSPYIYVWGNKYVPAELKPTLEYKVPGATSYKYMNEHLEIEPNWQSWKILHNVDESSFDFTWVPDPREPAYIYVWGNNHYPSVTMPTIEYHTSGATERKYMDDRVAKLLPKISNFIINDTVDLSKFDFSWVPDPNSPPYIYVWGNKYIPAELKSTIEYHCEGATERKYMGDDVHLLPESNRWKEYEIVDKTKFDMTWRPDPREPAYIYVWGNKYDPPEHKPTLEYHTPGAIDKKYMGILSLEPQWDRWTEYQKIDKTKFDYSWRPDPNLHEEPYIYVWGNKYIPGELKPSIEYKMPGATSYKYMPELVEMEPEWDRWKILQDIDKSSFDFAWRPDPREPAYIYVWGNNFYSGVVMPTVEYRCSDATEYKYMDDRVANLSLKISNFVVNDTIDLEKFDFSWVPDPNSPPYIYVWGNKYVPAELKSTVEYHVEGATEKKYMGNDVTLLPELDKWVETHTVDKLKFDMTWRPDPREPAYIYTWGNKYVPAELEPTIEYRCEGATERKYMGEVEVLPQLDKWKEIQQIDRTKFDLSWRPDPREPAYIYVWGNKYEPAELKPTLEYHCEGSTERKYMGTVDVLPELDRWKEIQPIDKSKFDMAWRPDPREPAYIYVWGNKWISGELKSTLEYHCPGATERKYMQELVEVLPELNNWKEVQQIDKSKFDLTWRPDPREPAYIYIWGNKWVPGELKSTLEYHCPGATERKYMGEVNVLPEQERWNIVQSVDLNKFDFTWRPDPREPAYIYVWGNKWIPGELKATLEYHCPDAIEYKYMGDVDVVPELDRWVEHQSIDKSKFDMSWRPDPREPAYIYTWGNKWISGELKPTLEYYCEGATERKYMGDVEVLPEYDRWNEFQKVTNFDFTWRPDPREPAYIYTWGNKWIAPELEPTLTYTVPGATEHKYMENVDVLPNTNNWVMHQEITNFDLSWRPDPREPAYIYTWGNKWVSAELEPTLEYHCEGATERKYMGNVDILPELNIWKIHQQVTNFDFTWRPDPREPAYIYTWGNKYVPAEIKSTIEYHCFGATERKYMGDVEVLPEIDKWKIHQPITNFDLAWRPDPREPAYIYTWGNKYVPAELEPTLEYHCAGATERKYMGDVEVLPQLDKWRELQPINKDAFDLSWRPDPREPAYIYTWGNKYVPAELEPTIEYHCLGATERKYMGDVEVLPQLDMWKIHQPITNFDMTWRPDPREPAYIYTWGNKYIPAELQPTLEYHCDDATERKYMGEVDVLPQLDKWKIYQEVTNFDLAWRPDPREPAYIYTWGNKWIAAELSPTIEYHCLGATERKYMGDVEVLPEFNKWKILHEVNNFDFTWRPDPREPAYIYVWGNKYVPGELESTLEYHCDGATEKKYMGEVDVIVQTDRWKVYIPVDVSKFDMAWRPDPREPAYIYVWGNKYVPAELRPTLEYYTPGATERKYVGEVEVLPQWDNYKIHASIANFDFTWMPDPREPAYIYTWGNKYVPAELEPTLEYYVDGAIERKYMGTVDVLPELDRWKEIHLIDKNKFDMAWRPDPREPAYIYTWGNKYVPAELEPTLEYHCPGATERKYMGEVEVLPELNRWFTYQENTFDMSWRPDPREPAYIYTWGNKYVPAEIQPTLEYRCPGATERKYMGDVEVLPETSRWKMNIPIDKSKFDMSWRPDPREPAYIYTWGNKYVPAELRPTLEYYCPDATERKYMGDVEVLPQWNNYKIYTPIKNFDFTWMPDPREPAYIYTWGNKYVPAELQPTLEYHCEGATERKYMGDVEVLPLTDRWVEYQSVDKSKFDMSWRPDPREPAYIYTWGNKYVPAEIKPTIEYHCENATERKYMGNVDVLPELDKWREIQAIDKSKFDLSWRPDPREPAYIYVWGNKYIRPELLATLEYHVEGATERKYIQDPIDVLPEYDKWNVVQSVTNFDFAWRPDPREPAYIYTWGNKWVSGELKPTVEYHCAGATERKYMGDAEVEPEWNRYQILIPIDKRSFDFTWRPDPREPAFIYVWGNQSNSAEVEPTIEYHCEGATERKYMSDRVAKTLPNSENWKVLIPVDNFDYSWRPDPGSPPYIYVFGNQWHDAMTEPTVEYHVPGATDKKYITDIVATVSKTQEHWKTLISIDSFDYSWRPNPHSQPYIYVFGNQWHDAVIEPTVEYHQPGATDRKYVSEVKAIVKSTATESLWKRLISVESFDYSWRPDPGSPPYIYVFGNKWNNAATEPTIEYHCQGATDKKYIDDPVAIPKAELQYWKIHNNDDLETFDFTWRPNPHSPPQIYQWADNGPTYTVPGATEVVLMQHNGETRKKVINRYKIKTTLEDLIAEHSDEVFWALNPDLNYDKFDFSWAPNEENFRHINVFGNEYSKNTQTYYINGPMYVLGYREYNYVETQKVETTDSNLSMFFIDKGNTESTNRFNELKELYPRLQKTRYLNTWVDTINRCIRKSETKLFWVLSSEIDYTDFSFDFYPSPWQMKMIHVFGTQWSHWGNTYLINGETFTEDTKYVKIIEHLNNLNFVKTKRAKAEECLYDIYLIDHGNYEVIDILVDLEDKANGRKIETVKYRQNYLETFKDILSTLETKNDHYIWICSSVCHYDNFDFSYICDPFAREHLHVFPSDKQKFGDTFLVNVNELRRLVNHLYVLEEYGEINFNNHQKLNRIRPPEIISKEDTHYDFAKHNFKFPYAVFKTSDHSKLVVKDEEPMSLWSDESKSIIVSSTGGTRIVVPKEAKNYVKNELYDYPFVKRVESVKSQPLDIVFLSNGEINAEQNYEHLLSVTKDLPNRVVRVDGVNGRVAAYHAAANASNTPWMFTVFAKLYVNEYFDWSWQPDRLQLPKHYIFTATNPVNELEYGHQAMIAYNKKLVLNNTGVGLDFTLDDQNQVVEINSGIAMFDTDEYSTWRTAFRESIKLRVDNTEESSNRLEKWLNVGIGPYGNYSIKGAQDGIKYYDEVNGDIEKLKLSYEWDWLKERFKHDNTKRNNKRKT